MSDETSEYNKFLISGLREKREGIQLERNLSLLSYLVFEWSSFNKEENLNLPIIEFEKLALLTYRIWNRLFDLIGLKDEDHSAYLEPEDESKLVTFPFPFRERKAKHGRRLIRYDGKDHINLAEIVYQLQSERINDYFQLTPYTPEEESSYKEKPSPDPNDYRTTVCYGTPITNRNDFLRDFTPKEKDLIKDFGNSLKRLKTEEIRALGTHENLEKTLEDIKKEFIDMKQRKHIMRVLSALENGDIFFYDAQKINEYADEAWRKSHQNRNHYENARALMLKEITEPELKSTFESCHCLPKEIWDSPEVTNLAEKAEKALGFSKYLLVIAYHQLPKENRKRYTSARPESFNYKWREGLEEMQKYFSTFETDFSSVFEEDTTRIRNHVRSFLTDKLQAISDWIDNEITNAK